MKMRLVICVYLITACSFCNSQTLNQTYAKAYDRIASYADNPQIGDFQKAVFAVENAFNHDTLYQKQFDRYISLLASMAKSWHKANPLNNYRYSDSLNFSLNFAIFHLLKDTVKVRLPNGELASTRPFIYNFDDFFGLKDWSNMFVTKLLATHKGNCHSLPYLYKMLSDELGATCWLSFAPNHIYIKNRCEKAGWYNTELTSGDFPIDAWIATSGYVPMDAIRNGIYMDTLSNQQAIAQCGLDLAKGYAFQTKNYSDGFILKCCDLTLKYHPLNIQAILFKAETLKRIYDLQKKEKKAGEVAATFTQLEALYTRLFELGYREMPDDMYMRWLQSIATQRNKYGNKKITEVKSL